MTPAPARRNLLLLVAALAGVALAAWACSWMLWRRLVTAVAPGGEREIGVWELPLYPADPVLAVTVKERGGIERTLYRLRGDRAPRLVEAAWGPGHADILLCDGATDPLLLRYTNGTLTPSEAGRRALGAVAARRYQLPPGQIEAFDGDPLKWACDALTDASDRYQAVIGDRKVLPGVAIPTEN